MRTGESSLLEPGGHKTGVGEPAKNIKVVFCLFVLNLNIILSFPPVRAQSARLGEAMGGGNRVLMESGSSRF